MLKVYRYNVRPPAEPKMVRGVLLAQDDMTARDVIAEKYGRSTSVEYLEIVVTRSIGCGIVYEITK